jgi:DNA replication protein DnaC
VLLIGPPGVGKSFLAQAIGYHVLKAGVSVLYRSIFAVVRDFLHDEALGGEDKVLARYLKPDLLIIDDMGMKQLPKRSTAEPFEPEFATPVFGPRAPARGDSRAGYRLNPARPSVNHA